METDRWWAYECYNHSKESKAGFTFDARISSGNSEIMQTVKCPLCGEKCEQKGNWSATESGHGSRGDGGYDPLIVLTKSNLPNEVLGALTTLALRLNWSYDKIQRLEEEMSEVSGKKP